jgi:hypothetical protein
MLEIAILLFCQLVVLCLIFQLLVSRIFLISLIKTVSGIPNDHIKKFFKCFSLKITFKFLSIMFMHPQIHEDLIDKLSIFELGVELVT